MMPLLPESTFQFTNFLSAAGSSSDPVTGTWAVAYLSEDLPDGITGGFQEIIHQKQLAEWLAHS